MPLQEDDGVLDGRLEERVGGEEGKKRRWGPAVPSAGGEGRRQEWRMGAHEI